MLETLYIVRHAAPDRAASIVYNIPPGPPLTSIGRLEAVQAAHWLRGRGIEQVLVSPFVRAQETAAPIAESLGLPAVTVELLKEGAPGESLADVQARVAELVAQLDDSPITTAAVVTHGACVLGLLKHTTGGSIDLRGHMYDYGNHAPTSGIWHGVKLDGIWRWNLAFRPVQGAEWA